MFRDIVLAVVPSKVCECAVDAAIAFAAKHEANLYLVHICGLPDQGWGSIEQLIPSGEVEQIKEDLCKYYQQKIEGLPNCELKVFPGLPHSEILRFARKVEADLIVMGPHTKENVQKRSTTWGMAGSTLEKVTQKARCPVMIVSREMPKESMSFKNILAATDFSSQAECALRYAGQLARQYKSKMHVLNVLDRQASVQDTEFEADIEGQMQKIKQWMEEEFSSQLQGVGDYSFQIEEGQPAMEILKFARVHDIDLILMAHHSKEEDPEKAYLGSTVAQVALNSSCPTLSVNRHFDLRCALY